MIVQRITVRYKVGKVQEAISLLKEVTKETQGQGQFPDVVRFYTPRHISDTTVGDFEFENTSAMEQFWANWQTLPEAEEFGRKYDLLVEPGMIFEIFDVV